MDLIYLRDQEQRHHTTQVQQDAKVRMDQLQSPIDLLLQNNSYTLGGSNSTGASPWVTLVNTLLPAKNISLGFPHFDGQTPVLEWIFKAKIFFYYHRTLDEERVNIVAIHFDKDVVPWF